VAGSELERWYYDRRYQPYPAEEMIDLMIRIKILVPGYVRISRVMRDIPGKFIIAGLKDSSLRDAIKRRMKELGVSCRCIRCREYGHRQRDGLKIGDPQLHRLDYQASGGQETFLSFEDDRETLFGLLRLRVKKGQDFALVREVHVFGPEVPMRGEPLTAVQHKGLGRGLLKEAEQIAKVEFQARHLRILSGVGARDYFREWGYSLEKSYMVKEL
jgi:elongator complex protein 3